MRSTKPTSNSPTTCCAKSTGWNSTSTKRARWCAQSTGRWSSSPRTTRRNCRTLSCAAASSTTSSFLTRTRCSKPSTSELIDWLKLLLAEDIPAETLHSKDGKAAIPPLHGALLKNEQDVHLFERLVFMSRNNR